MRTFLIVVAVVTAVCGAADAQEQPTPCIGEPSVYLDTTLQDFDQGVRVNASGQREEWGWRAIYRRPGCVGAAANLIELWRQHNDAKLQPRDRAWLEFHEGQLRAEAGQTGRAIALIESGYTALPSDSAWTLFVDAILAFLREDERALWNARASLLALPEPSNWPQIQKMFREQAGQEMSWPQNIEAVDHLILCFGHPYPLGNSDPMFCPAAPKL